MSQHFKGPLFLRTQVKPKVHSCSLRQFRCILNCFAWCRKKCKLWGQFGAELMMVPAPQISKKRILYIIEEVGFLVRKVLPPMY